MAITDREMEILKKVWRKGRLWTDSEAWAQRREGKLHL